MFDIRSKHCLHLNRILVILATTKMDKLYRTFFKKKHLRNLAAMLFLLVMAVEHSSHSFSLGDHHTGISSTEIDLGEFGVNVAESSDFGVSVIGNQTSSHDNTICQDEVSHHVVVLSAFEFSFERNEYRDNKSYAFLFKDPLYRSPSPPFNPPKFS